VIKRYQNRSIVTAPWTPPSNPRPEAAPRGPCCSSFQPAGSG